MVRRFSLDTDDPLREEAQYEILARINTREQEIERIFHEVRESAAARIREARRQEVNILAAGLEEAGREADRVSGEILARARREAAEILAAGAGEAAKIRAVPRDRVERTAAHLLAMLLPAVPRERREP